MADAGSISTRNSDIGEIVGLLALLVALLVAGLQCRLDAKVSRESLTIAQQSADTARQLSLLDVCPQLRLACEFVQADTSPPIYNGTFILHNDGPIDAVQIEVMLTKMFGSTASKETSRIYLLGLENPLKIDRLPPQGVVSRRLPLESFPAVAAEPPEYSALELVVKYRRESDRKLLVDRAIYFVVAGNRLVNASSKDVPKDVLAAAYDSPVTDIEWPVRYNELCPVREYKPALGSPDTDDRD